MHAPSDKRHVFGKQNVVPDFRGGLLPLVGYRINVNTDDNRKFAGKLVSFDRNGNVALLDTEEDVTSDPNYQDKMHAIVKRRQLSYSQSTDKDHISADNDIPKDGVYFKQVGFIILRGTCIQSISLKNANYGRIKTEVRNSVI